MKNMRRVICSVLAAVMVLAALPLCTALAATEITSIELGAVGHTSSGHICCAITSRPLRYYING